MSAPKLTEAQVRALTYLVHVGRRLEMLTRGHDKRVGCGLAEVQDSEFGPCWAATDAGRAALEAHEKGTT